MTVADDPNAGGAGSGDPGSSGDPNAGGDPGQGAPKPGDPNYQSERERELSAEAARHRREAKAAKDELEQLKRQQQSEHERAVEDARKEERERLEGAHRRELVELRVIAIAGGKLTDGRDAVPHVDVDALAELEGSALDAAIGKAIDELLEAKPYLARGDGSSSSGGGLGALGSGGVRGGAGGGQGSGEGGGETDSWLRKPLRR